MEQECDSMTFCSNLSANEKVGSGYVNDPGFLQKSSRTFLPLAISHFLREVNANMHSQLIPLTLNDAGWNCTGPPICGFFSINIVAVSPPYLRVSNPQIQPMADKDHIFNP